jgi:hypothetical protein
MPRGETDVVSSLVSNHQQDSNLHDLITRAAIECWLFPSPMQGELNQTLAGLGQTFRDINATAQVAERLNKQVSETVALQNFFDGAAIAEPKELGVPKEFVVLADSPATTSGFANGTQARSTIHGQIEGADTIQMEQSKGDCGGISVVRLHEDPAHAGASSICLEKKQGREESQQARQGEEAMLSFSLAQRLTSNGIQSKRAIELR